jgi:BlaI family penicillinase repressor
MKKAPFKVTDLELMILQQIWAAEDNSTVNNIIDAWPESKKPGYTTILKTLQKMEAKGVVGHKQEGKKYSYFSKISKDKITKKRLGTIIDRMFSGDKASFAEYFIHSNQFDKDELRELKKLIAKKEKEGR